MRTFVFKAYASKRNRELHKQINIAASIWNHCIALHKRYYRRFEKHLNQFQLMKRITKLKRLPRYNHWNNLGSQAVQDVVQRIEKSYQLFFSYLKTKKAGKPSGRKVRPPSFRKRQKYTSFTLKQAGYTVSDNNLKIGKQQYRFFKSREIEGKIKTLTIKRDSLGDIYFVFVTDAEHQTCHAATTEIAGMDFGLKDFLTISDGTKVAAPQPLKKALKQLKKSNINLSRKPVIEIDRWHPSSKLCHACSCINQGLSLKERTWSCTCGAFHDRDLNAAINIQRAGASALGLGDVSPGSHLAIAA